MSYAYQAVDDLLDQQKQNIFAGEQAGQNLSGGQSQSPEVKVSTQNTVGSGGSSGGSAPQQPQSSAQPYDSGAVTRAAVKANTGKTAAPAAFGQIESMLGRNQAQLQQEADAYVQKGKAAQSYNIGQSDLSKAIEGDKTQSEAVSALRNRQDINPIESEFKFSGGPVSDADLLRSEAGLKQLAARGQGPRYTPGMAAFDVQTLRKAPGFEQTVAGLQGKQEALNKSVAEAEASKRGEIEKYGQEALAAAQRDVTGRLTGALKGVEDLNAREASDFNALLQKYRAQGIPDAGRKALQDARSSVEADLGQNDPRSAKFVGQAKVDPNKFLKVRGDVAGGDFYDQAEADRFNRIAGLLGASDTRMASQPVGPAYSVDRGGLEKAIASGTAQLREQADVGQQEALRKITGAAEKKAQAALAANKKIDLKQVSSDEAANVAKALPKDLAKFYRPGLVDPGKFIKAEAAPKASDFYTVDDAKRINAIYKDLGLPDRVKSGYDVSQKGYTFDAKGYQAALSSILGDMKKGADAAKGNTALGSSLPGSALIPTSGMAALDSGPSAAQLASSNEYVRDPRLQARPTLGRVDLSGGYY